MVSEVLRAGDRGRQAVLAAVFLLSLLTDITTIWHLAGSALLGWWLAGRAEA